YLADDPPYSSTSSLVNDPPTPEIYTFPYTTLFRSSAGAVAVHTATPGPRTRVRAPWRDRGRIEPNDRGAPDGAESAAGPQTLEPAPVSTGEGSRDFSPGRQRPGPLLVSEEDHDDEPVPG